MTMIEMIDETFAKHLELQEKRGYYPNSVTKSFLVDNVGLVVCKLTVKHGRSGPMRSHFSKNWKLNGERISAENLAEILTKNDMKYELMKRAFHDWLISEGDEDEEQRTFGIILETAKGMQSKDMTAAYRAAKEMLLEANSGTQS